MNRMPSLSPSFHPNRVLIQLFQCLLAASLGTAAGEEMTWVARAGYGATDVEGRHHPITFANETHGFLFSGGSRRSGATKDFYLYDEAADKWTDLTDTVGKAFPGVARSFAYGIVLNEADHPKAYLGFGVGPSDERLNDWWELDMRTYEWKELASLPGLGRRHPAMNPVKKTGGGWEIHVGLGDGILNADDPENARFSNLNDWFVYDVDDDSWEQMPDLPSSRRHHPFYFGLGSSSYAGLGHSDGYRPYIERDWYKFDHDTKTWTQETDFASYEAADDGTYPEAPVTTEARVAGAQFAIDLPLRSTDPLRGSLGFVLSGDGDNHYAIATGEFQAFYPEGSDLDAGPVGDGKSWWRQLPPHPGYSRWAPGSFVMRGSARAYFTSGYDRVYQRLHADLWMIDLSPLFAENPVAPEQTTEATEAPAPVTQAPAKYELGTEGEMCPTDFSLGTRAECEEAHEELGLAYNKNNVWEGNSKKMPVGCSYWGKKKRMFVNKSGKGKGRDGRTPICKVGASEATDEEVTEAPSTEAPTDGKYYLGGLQEKCPANLEITDSTQCKEAHKELNLPLGKVWSGRNRNFPLGCSSRGNKRMYFNNHNGRANKLHAPICLRTAPETTTASYVLGNVNSVCGPGKVIMDEKECAQAHSDLDLPVGNVWKGSNKKFPMGCAHNTGKKRMFFNNSQEGRRRGSLAPICKA